jgi:hypothetical protein
VYAIAIIFFFVGYLIFQQYQISSANRYDATQTAQGNRITAEYQRQEKAATVPTQALLSQAISALSKRDINAEMTVLLQQQIQQWRQEIIANEEPILPASDPPSWSTSFWLAVTVGFGTTVVAVSVVGYLLPSNRSVFLIGDEKRRQERAQQLRANIKWVIIAGIAVTVISSFILSHLH